MLTDRAVTADPTCATATTPETKGLSRLRLLPKHDGIASPFPWIGHTRCAPTLATVCGQCARGRQGFPAPDLRSWRRPEAAEVHRVRQRPPPSADPGRPFDQAG